MMLTISVNGVEKKIEVDPRETLLDALRDRIGLTGPKKGCDETVCGACAVMLDGKAVCSCTMLAVEAQGRDVLTIEGLSKGENELDSIQRAFIEHDSLQCGFCTAGQIISAKSYLMHLSPDAIPSDEEIKEALSGNLCRCGCYNKIVEAVKEVAVRRAGREP